ncbi:hypothetical protein VHEMI08064 [[Torrubiella] hemipterigena]|uniref:WW domain-containing protein n=1 Tax=[Torrubiella] hemipterigena TaxID=1531966 RepID=A0A0A1TMI0_9HYPO|nr:hypothetical protein VHEMI08064 [[Torrubiella] hemipterigena]
MSAPQDYPPALHPGAAPPAYQAYNPDTKQPTVSEQPINQQQQQHQYAPSQPQYGQQVHQPNQTQYGQPQHQQHGAAPALPQGWISEWSYQHNAWFYVYTPTGLTQWEMPKPPASPNQSFPPPPPGTAPGLETTNNEGEKQNSPPTTDPTNQSENAGAPGQFPSGQPGQPGQGPHGQSVQYHPQQQHAYNQGMQPQHGMSPQQGMQGGEMPGPDGERGLGKAALLVGGGLLAAASFGPLKNKIGKYFGNKPPGGQQGGYQQQGGYPPQQQYNYGTPLPPPSPYNSNSGPQQPTYGGVPPPMAGHVNPVGGSGGAGVPPLFIHAATFADRDITQVVRSLITRNQSLEFKGKELKNRFSDPWPGADRKSFIVLYQYGDRPMEVLASDDQEELIEIKHGAISKKRMDFCQPPPARIVCCIWGVANATSAANSQQLETAGEMEASKETLGDGDWYSWEHRTLNCFYRDDHGNISIVSCREGGTLRMPWNPLAKWS